MPSKALSADTHGFKIGRRTVSSGWSQVTDGAPTEHEEPEGCAHNLRLLTSSFVRSIAVARARRKGIARRS
jgi:hypothetical protein